MGRRLIAVIALLCLCPAAAGARLAISGNDGKQVLAGDQDAVMPDSISVIDFAVNPPKIVGQVQVPAAMIGPPEAVVVSRDESFAIVTAAQKYNAADPLHPLDDDKVSVIDLSQPSKPRVLETLASGAGASGIAMNRAQNLVLVAAKMEDAIIIFRLAGKNLSPAGRLDLGKGAAPTDVVFAPDGRHAYAVAWGVTDVTTRSGGGVSSTVIGRAL